MGSETTAYSRNTSRVQSIKNNLSFQHDYMPEANLGLILSLTPRDRKWREHFCDIFYKICMRDRGKYCKLRVKFLTDTCSTIFSNNFTINIRKIMVRILTYKKLWVS